MSIDKLPSYGQSPYGHTSPTPSGDSKHPRSVAPDNKSLPTKFVDSFRKHPSLHTVEKKTNSDGETYDVEMAATNLAQSPLARRLKGRHLQMIAIGGSIGTGLFVGSGRALSVGGPAGLVIAFSVIGFMLYCTVHALGELAILFPVAGSFASYSSRFIDPAWGFAMGWNYAAQWLIVLPLEIVAATMTLNFWDDGHGVPKAVWVTIFFIIIIVINLFGVKGYGEAEFVFSMIKIVAVISFIILGVTLNCAGGKDGSYIGGKYWRDPGAFANGFKGICSVFLNAAFAFSGTELVGMAAAETANPRKSLPTAVKQVFWRITLFYIVSLVLVGLLVPYDNDMLNLTLTGVSGTDVAASPFVIAIQYAGITVLPSVMNGVIMIAVLSVGNSSVFGASRTLAALAEQGQAPKILAYVDRQGRPLVGIAVAALFGLLSYLGAASVEIQTSAFTWMLAISGLSSIFTWGSICLCHIRFRHAWALKGHNLTELAFLSQPGILGSWVGLVLNCLVLVTSFWIALFPIHAKPSVSDFFETFLCVPIIIVTYLGYKFWFKTKYVKTIDMDLVTGRRELDISALLVEERAERALWPMWKKIYKIFC